MDAGRKTAAQTNCAHATGHRLGRRWHLAGAAPPVVTMPAASRRHLLHREDAHWKAPRFECFEATRRGTCVARKVCFTEMSAYGDVLGNEGRWIGPLISGDTEAPMFCLRRARRCRRPAVSGVDNMRYWRFMRRRRRLGGVSGAAPSCSAALGALCVAYGPKACSWSKIGGFKGGKRAITRRFGPAGGRREAGRLT